MSTTPSLTVASIVKNEAGRFLPKALEVWGQFADRIVVLDDGSTDETPDILRAAGVEVHTEPVGMFGQEWKARKRLFELATEGAENVLWLDADQIPASNPKPYIRGVTFGFRVFDLWDEGVYRDDPWWGGHRKPWWRGVHAPSLAGPFLWDARGWHSGHLPNNLPPETVEMPLVCSILHYAYATPALRQAKATMYSALAGHLTEKERFHAMTILTKRPICRELPFAPTWSLLG